MFAIKSISIVLHFRTLNVVENVFVLGVSDRSFSLSSNRSGGCQISMEPSRQNQLKIKNKKNTKPGNRAATARHLCCTANTSSQQFAALASSIITMETETSSASEHSCSEPEYEYLKDFYPKVSPDKDSKNQKQIRSRTMSIANLKRHVLKQH